MLATQAALREEVATLRAMQVCTSPLVVLPKPGPGPVGMACLQLSAWLERACALPQLLAALPVTHLQLQPSPEDAQATRLGAAPRACLYTPITQL